MLILTRRRYEKVYIGDNITIRVERTGRKYVSLSFDVPKNIPIKRAKLLSQEAINENNKNTKYFMKDQAKEGML